MSKRARILVYGRDPALLETRRLVLESKEEPVASTTDFADACRCIDDGQLELLVLCFTLFRDDRTSILAVARQLRPEMKILVLEADGPPPPTIREGVFNIFSGPRVMRARITALLAGQ